MESPYPKTEVSFCNIQRKDKKRPTLKQLHSLAIAISSLKIASTVFDE
jgi:hypothetical protein